MGNRSIFREAFMGRPSARRPFAVKPITLAVYSYDIPPEALGDWLKHALPDGYVGASSRVVKVLDGEFVISPNGTAQFVALGRSPSDPFSI